MHSDSLSKQRTNYIDSNESPKAQTCVRRKPGRPPKQHPPGTINGIIADCAVCHDKATGLHYAVMTCEGCKGFFKRSIQAEKIYKCRNGTYCAINKETRNACQACRMKRCYDMGMKEKLVRDDRTPGNRKKKCAEPVAVASHHSSENSDNTAEFVKREPRRSIKNEGYCIEPINDIFVDEYHVSNKKKYEQYNTDYCTNLSTFNFGNISLSPQEMDHGILYNPPSYMKNCNDWQIACMSRTVMADDHHTTDQSQHIASMCDESLQISINCSGDQELPAKKCRQSTKCLMHLLTRLMKAKPIEAAFCKYLDIYPSSEQFLDCLADEIHIIIKFAKKTPGFCELTMGRKLNIVQKHALSILFVRIIYRSLTCPINHVQFASNICLSYNDLDKIDILSSKFRQTIIDLIASFRSINLDIYELCLIQYAMIECDEEYWDPDMRYYPVLEGIDPPTSNISQKYLKLYTINKYPDQPHRWIFIMLSLKPVHEMVKLFITQCLDMVHAQRMAISNDILKEILSI